MRLSESIIVAARPQLVWGFIAEPANALNYFSGITRWEVEGDKRTGLGARYRMLMRVGAAEMGGLVEVVEFSEPRDMAWSSVTGVDQRGRWRLRKAGGGRTRVEFRFAYGVAGAGITGYISERVAAPSVRRHLRRTLQQLKREVEREQLREDAARRKAERESAAA
jgi:carbon monoxide dehydrogenase subunit G